MNFYCIYFTFMVPFYYLLLFTQLQKSCTTLAYLLYYTAHLYFFPQLRLSPLGRNKRIYYLLVCHRSLLKEARGGVLLLLGADVTTHHSSRPVEG